MVPTTALGKAAVSSLKSMETQHGPWDLDPFPYIAAVATMTLLCNLEKVTSMPQKCIPEKCGKLLILKHSASPYCVGKIPVNQN